MTVLTMVWVIGLMTPAAVAQNVVKLAWDANTESALSGYKVYYGSTSRVYSASVDVGNVTGYTLNIAQHGTYYIAVTAYDNLQNESDYSNEVSTSIGSCTYLISPTSRTHDEGAESGTISVSAGAGCSWSAASGFPWISIVSGATGTGSGTVSYSLQANPSSTSRSGTIAVAGQTFVVTQGVAGSCTYAISPTSRTHGLSAESGTISVSAGTGCSWTATSSFPWISIVSGAAGSGDGTVGYSVQVNPSSSTRSGTIAVAGQTFVVTQGVAGSCTYAISPTGRTHGLSAESGTISVSASAGCSWSAATGFPWISIVSGATGTGPGTVGYSLQANPSSTSRSGTITVAGQAFLVTQGTPGFCDVNRDGQITIDDLQLLTNIVLGKSICPSNCDLNHDARLDVADLQTLANVILGVSTCH